MIMKNFTLKLALWASIFGLFINLPSMAQTGVADSVATVIGITNTTAFTGGWVTTGELLTERGVCYGTSENPTIDDNKVPSFKNSPVVAYEPAYLEGLTPNTTYYVRAYATGSTGTVYSDQKSFKTTDNAEVLWQLTGATGYDAAVTGALSADPMVIADTTELVKFDQANGKDISIGNDYLKIKPAGSAGGASFDSLIYFGFNVAPKADVDFTVKKFNLVYSGYKTGGANLVFDYSLDGFATQDSLGAATLDDMDRTQSRGTVVNPIKPGSGSLDNEFANIGQMYISFSPDINVPAGKTLSIRMYAWGKGGLTVLMKDVVMSGEVSTSLAAGTAVIDSVSSIVGITNTTAFTGSWVNAMDGALTERGVCYSTKENPTILDNTVPSFKVSPAVAYEPAYLEGLMPNTTYYVRAYGKNETGVSYSAQKSFKTTDNAEVLWQLSNFRQYDAVVTGEITADTMAIDTTLTVVSGWDKNNGKDISIGSDYFKVVPQGSALGLDYNPDSYFSFNVAPKADVSFTVKNLNLVCSGYKSSGATLAFAYSLDGFATQDSLGVATLDDMDMTQSMGTMSDPIKPGSGSLDNEFANIGQMYISFSTNIEVPAGDSLSIRMWVWGKNGITLLMKDVILSGETSEGTPTGIRANISEAAPSFKVYPTVAGQNIHVEATSRIEAIKIVSIDGRVMKIVTPNSQSNIIDVSNFRNGLYLVVVKTETGIGSKKIIVNK